MLIGRICRNIDLKKTQNDISVCNITLAIPRNYKNINGEYDTDFITCICYRNIAEKVAEWCQKGDLVGIKGMIQSKTYEKEGKKIYTTEIVADKVTFLSSKSKEINEDIKKESNSDSNKDYEEFASENSDLPF